MVRMLLLITVLFYQRGYGATYNVCVTPPLECPNPNITFWLYTRNTQNSPQQLNISDPDSIKQANFIPNVPVKLLIHGYTGDKDYDPNTDTRPAYFRRGDYNVISVDYSPLVRDPCYQNAVENVPLVGLCIAQMIDELVKTKMIPLENFHVVGMSLGAHVSGAISNWLVSGKLERITGLDPALPFFVSDDITVKLDKTDAKFVDVIHTNSLGMGKLEPSGHADFYVNGGLIQPGCEQYKNISVNRCSHWKSALYFAESINTEVGFYGKKCDSWLKYTFGLCDLYRYQEEIIMGDLTPSTSSGLYFLYTNAQAPFSRGHWAIQPPGKKMNNDSLLDSYYEDIPLRNIEILNENITQTNGNK